jgi:hypothetical protein
MKRFTAMIFDPASSTPAEGAEDLPSMGAAIRWCREHAGSRAWEVWSGADQYVRFCGGNWLIDWFLVDGPHLVPEAIAAWRAAPSKAEADRLEQLARQVWRTTTEALRKAQLPHVAALSGAPSSDHQR